MPGLAAVAKQQGEYVGKLIGSRLRNESPLRPFQYVDKGTLATIGRHSAIADLPQIKLTGTLAWLLWGVVHLYFLIGFRNRTFVFLNWFWAWLTYARGARLIIGAQQTRGDYSIVPEHREKGASITNLGLEHDRALRSHHHREPGRVGGRWARRFAPTGKSILLMERGDYLPREREKTWDVICRVSSRRSTEQRRPGTAATDGRSIPAFVTTSAATRKCTGRRCFACARRTSAKSGITAVFARLADRL